MKKMYKNHNWLHVYFAFILEKHSGNKIYPTIRLKVSFLIFHHKNVMCPLFFSSEIIKIYTLIESMRFIRLLQILKLDITARE